MKSNKRNLFESVIDVGSGLLLAIGIQLIVFPFFDMYPTIWDSFHIAIIFTCMSVFRSWFWRTLFERRKKVKEDKKIDEQTQEWIDNIRMNGNVVPLSYKVENSKSEEEYKKFLGVFFKGEKNDK